MAKKKKKKDTPEPQTTPAPETTPEPQTTPDPHEPPQAPDSTPDPSDEVEAEKLVKMYYPHCVEIAASSQTIYGYDAKRIDDELWVVEVPEHLVKIELKRQFGAPLVKKKPAKKTFGASIQGTE